MSKEVFVVETTGKGVRNETGYGWTIPPMARIEVFGFDRPFAPLFSIDDNSDQAWRSVTRFLEKENFRVANALE